MNDKNFKKFEQKTDRTFDTMRADNTEKRRETEGRIDAIWK